MIVSSCRDEQFEEDHGDLRIDKNEWIHYMDKITINEINEWITSLQVQSLTRWRGKKSKIIIETTNQKLKG